MHSASQQGPATAPVAHAAAWGAAGAAALASVFFGGMVFSMRFVAGQADAMTVAFGRSAIGALCLLPVLIRFGWAPWRREDRAGVVALGVLLYAVMPLSLALAMRYTTASRGALVLASQTLITLLLSRWRGEERLSAGKMAGIALTAAGLTLALGTPATGGSRPGAAPYWIGDGILFFTALCVSLYTVLSRPYLRRYPALPFTAATLAVGALTLAPLALGMAWWNGPPAFTPLGWAAMAYIGTFGAAIGYFLWTWALERAPPSRVALFMTLNPLTATLLGSALLGETLTATFAAGLVIVLAGILAAHAPPRRGAAP